MVDDSKSVLWLEKYSKAFLSGNPDTLKESLCVCPNALTVLLCDSCTSAKTVLHTLFRLERKYQSLQFSISKKLLSRNENLDDMYLKLKDSFESLSISNECTSSLISQDKIRIISECFALVCHVRCKMLAFYTVVAEKQTMMGCSSENLCCDLIDLKTILTSSRSGLDCILSPILELLDQELELVTSLLKIQFLVSNLHFLSSILCFASLKKFVSNKADCKTGKVLSYLQGRDGVSPLFSWLFKLRSTLLAKFSLYWFNVLRNIGTADDLHNCLALENPDLVLRLQAFTTLPEVAYASLFFDAHLQDFAYLGHSYVPPGSVGVAPKGVESLPAILTLPTEAHPQLVTDLSVIMMKLTAMLGMDASIQPRKIISIHDASLKKTFFLAKLEPRIYFAIAIYRSQQLQLFDSKNTFVINFMNKFGSTVQLVDISKELRTP